MPAPMAICLEDLDATDPSVRYLRCVALVGREPGLRLSRGGAVLWQSDEAVACELWVSADDKLILYRPKGGAPVTVSRQGRSLEVPLERPVVLLDKDRFEVGGRHLCVHVHGEAPQVAAPSMLPSSSLRQLARVAAAALAISAAAGASADGPIEVRGRPPAVAVERPPTRPSPKPTGSPAQTPPGTPQPSPIEVRERPPEVAAPEPPPQPASVSQPAPEPSGLPDPFPGAGPSAGGSGADEGALREALKARLGPEVVVADGDEARKLDIAAQPSMEIVVATTDPRSLVNALLEASDHAVRFQVRSVLLMNDRLSIMLSYTGRATEAPEARSALAAWLKRSPLVLKLKTREGPAPTSPTVRLIARYRSAGSGEPTTGPSPSATPPIEIRDQPPAPMPPKKDDR
ncbi:MAG: hypothetical protein HY815_06885 [Candidatus Riflebacteria bacterium]|nr:hypothetical protein [Candidatus Riflebacteria bacterium]